MSKVEYTWFLISSKKVLDLLEKYRDSRSDTFKKAKAFAKKHGADTKNIWHIDDGSFLRITGFNFKEHPGDLWKTVAVSGRRYQKAYIPSKLSKSKELRAEYEAFRENKEYRELHGQLAKEVGWEDDIVYMNDGQCFVSHLNFFWTEKGGKFIAGFRVPKVPEDKNKYKNVKEIKAWQYYKMFEDEGDVE